MESFGLEDVVQELKNRGIAAGQKQAEEIEAAAKEKAAKIVADARAEAEGIKAAAKAEKEATLAAMRAEMAQAGRVGLTAFRKAIEDGFLVPEVAGEVKSALGKQSVLEPAILELVRAFAKQGMKSSQIEVLLPAARQKDLAGAFVTKLRTRGAAGVNVAFDESLTFGFRIGPKGEGFSFDLSDEGFQEIFLRFLSPRFREAFFAPAEAKQA